MIFRNYNDFEIINLIKEGDDEAFRLLVDKYQFLIAKKVKSFNLTQDYEDCFQEALMILHKSVIKFDETYNKTFTRYFEANLHNFLISYKNKKMRYYTFKTERLPILCDYILKENETTFYTDEEIFRSIHSFSEFEKRVYQIKIIENRTVRECSEILKVEEKKVYNAIDRIRKKIKLHLMT